MDQGWIPCATGDGLLRLFGLREVLTRARAIQEIVDPSPLTTAALHRLLLAILHRCFGPRDRAEWATIWDRGGFDGTCLNSYFDRWRERFDLFHPEHPFYQVAGLERHEAKPIAKLTHELASEANSPLLFDHTLEASLSPAGAARYLLAYQNYSVGGMISLRKGEPPGQYKFTDAAPLIKGALTLIKGNNLFQTLMLNLHRYSPEDSVPFVAEPDDCPAWEREQPTDAIDRYPRGYLDLLTWQSRRVRLFPEIDESGQVVVRFAALMKGYQFPDSFKDARQQYETMLAFRKIPKPGAGMSPWADIGFRPDRALWRDSLSLFQSVAETSARPRNVDWLAELVERGCVDWSWTLSLDLLGMCTAQAKVLLWRHERLPMPVRYVDPELGRDLVATLRLALVMAELAGEALYESARDLAALLIQPNANRPGASEPRQDTIRAMLERLAPARQYWSRLEVPFRKLLVELPDDTNADGSSFGQRSIPEWAVVVRRAARAAFAEVTNGLEVTPRALPAVARAENRFEQRLNLAIWRSLDSLGLAQQPQERAAGGLQREGGAG